MGTTSLSSGAEILVSSSPGACGRARIMLPVRVLLLLLAACALCLPRVSRANELIVTVYTPFVVVGQEFYVGLGFDDGETSTNAAPPYTTLSWTGGGAFNYSDSPQGAFGSAQAMTPGPSRWSGP